MITIGQRSKVKKNIPPNHGDTYPCEVITCHYFAIMAGYFAIMAGYGNGEGGGGGGVFLGFEKKIPKYPVEMCKGIKDLFLVIYRNHLHHLHPFWTILEDFGNKELAVFLVFAVVLVVVDFGH